MSSARTRPSRSASRGWSASAPRSPSWSRCWPIGSASCAAGTTCGPCGSRSTGCDAGSGQGCCASATPPTPCPPSAGSGSTWPSTTPSPPPTSWPAPSVTAPSRAGTWPGSSFAAPCPPCWSSGASAPSRTTSSPPCWPAASPPSHPWSCGHCAATRSCRPSRPALSASASSPSTCAAPPLGVCSPPAAHPSPARQRPAARSHGPDRRDRPREWFEPNRQLIASWASGWRLASRSPGCIRSRAWPLAERPSRRAELDEWGLLGPRECRRRCPVALDDEIDADPQLPNELRDRHQRLYRATGRNDVQDDEGSRDDDERPTDQPEHGKARGHQAGPVHEPPQDQAVPDADEDARPDPERPLIDRKDALPERGVGPARRGLAKSRDGEHADDADRDEGALHQARRHVRDGARFVYALVDRVRHHGRPDVGDDEEEFEHCPDRDEGLGVSPRARDVVAFVVEHRGVEEESRGYRRHEGDDP